MAAPAAAKIAVMVAFIMKVGFPVTVQVEESTIEFSQVKLQAED